MLSIRRLSLASLFLFAVASVPVQAYEGYVVETINMGVGPNGQYLYSFIGLSPTCGGAVELYRTSMDPIFVGILNNARLHRIPVSVSLEGPPNNNTGVMITGVQVRQAAALELAGKCL